MNLLDLPRGCHDPVATLLGFHRRIERQLAALGQLPGNLEARGIDAHSIADAVSILEFFAGPLAIHHADEEELMPMLEARIANAAERDAVRALRHRLEAEHRDMDRTWKSLRRPLEGIAVGMRRNLPVDLVQYFRACQSTHISLEEAGLHATAARCLLGSDRAALERGMQARRTRQYRFQ
jgi:hemerythrin-like domain-containing protein